MNGVISHLKLKASVSWVRDALLFGAYYAGATYLGVGTEALVANVAFIAAETLSIGIGKAWAKPTEVQAAEGQGQEAADPEYRRLDAETAGPAAAITEDPSFLTELAKRTIFDVAWWNNFARDTLWMYLTIKQLSPDDDNVKTYTTLGWQTPVYLGTSALIEALNAAYEWYTKKPDKTALTDRVTRILAPALGFIAWDLAPIVAEAMDRARGAHYKRALDISGTAWISVVMGMFESLAQQTMYWKHWSLKGVGALIGLSFANFTAGAKWQLSALMVGKQNPFAASVILASSVAASNGATGQTFELIKANFECLSDKTAGRTIVEVIRDAMRSCFSGGTCCASRQAIQRNVDAELAGSNELSALLIRNHSAAAVSVPAPAAVPVPV